MSRVPRPVVRLVPRLVASVAAGAALVVAPPAVARDDDGPADCANIQAQADGTHFSTDQKSLPLEEMGVDDALARLKKEHIKPGAGVTVAVIDSGVSDQAPVTFAGHVDAGNKVAAPSDYHGTAVAGLIAGAPRARRDGGPVGIAPAARILDVQVYDEAGASTDKSSPQSPMTVDNLRLGLQAVIDAVPSQGIRIVNMSLAIPDDDQIRDQIAQLTSLGVVVVAPTGNRKELPPDLPASFEQHTSGEDAAPYVHPADYPGVLGVKHHAGRLEHPNRWTGCWRTPTPTSPRRRPAGSPTHCAASPVS